MRFFIGLFAFFIWAVLFSIYKLKRASRGRQATFTEFVNEEREANAARRQDIDASLYFTPDLSLIPLRQDGSKQEENLAKIAKRTMIRFPERVSNTALKKRYGPSQLELITQYEENYNDYISALIDLAQSHAESGSKQDALRILEYTLELGSEYRKSYQLTASLYVEEGETDKLEKLHAIAEERKFADEGIKRWIIKMIRDKKDGMAIN